MVPDRIDRDIVIDAPLDVVWAVVTDPAHVAQWFSDSAEIDLRPEGDALFTWTDHGAYPAQIVRVEPPHAFAFQWIRRAGFDISPGNRTLVEFDLWFEEGRTHLRVVETGFAELDWPDDERETHARENRQGWGNELDELRSYVATLAAAAPPP
jgi:uncharacterized protein YndB with AHSA1/START domain